MMPKPAVWLVMILKERRIRADTLQPITSASALRSCIVNERSEYQALYLKIYGLRCALLHLAVISLGAERLGLG
jgi:hypothetical protein